MAVLPLSSRVNAFEREGHLVIFASLSSVTVSPSSLRPARRRERYSWYSRRRSAVTPCDIRRAAVDAGAVRVHLVLAAWTNVEGEIGKAAADPGTSLDPDIRPVIIPSQSAMPGGRFQQIHRRWRFHRLQQSPRMVHVLALCKLDRVVARACAQQTQISKPAVGAGERTALFHQKRQVQPCLDRFFRFFRARVPDGQRRAVFNGERTVRTEHIAVQIQCDGLADIRIVARQCPICQQF